MPSFGKVFRRLETPPDTWRCFEDRVAGFKSEIRGILQDQATLQAQINRSLDELDDLHEAVGEVHDREKERQEEFIMEREPSPMPYRAMVMPWNKEGESEKRFRRSVLVALLVCLFLGILTPMVSVPVPDRSIEMIEIPERLAMLVKKEPPKPPPPAPEPEVKSPPDENKPKPEETTRPEPEKPKVAADDKKPPAVPKKTDVGVLAFKKTFAGLMDETPIAKLGTEARISSESPQVAGQAVAQRSLVAMQARGGTSGGIANHGVSRNVGSGNADRIGGDGTGMGFSRVESGVAGLAEASRPLSEGPGPGRSDEEIQIVFDRYKATLYRIYNTELRRDPTLRGKMLLRISIEPGGEVSMCKVESTDLASPALVAQIVERIRRFNFGPKEDVLKVTILYPIDFLPAG
jgi:hypothetical protein